MRVASAAAERHMMITRGYAMSAMIDGY